LKGFLLVPALCLAGIPAAAQSQDSSQQQTGDPLADAARKAREAKKEAPKPKKVYTDDDLKKGEPAPDPASNSTAGNASGTATSSAGQGKADDPNAEAAWRKKFQNQRDLISRAEKELDLLQRELEKAQVAYYPDPQKALMEQNNRQEINDKTAKIDAKKKEIDQLKQGMEDMEDQLRKSGGDPGWAR
jgi:chromosome segregation ATPase